MKRRPIAQHLERRAEVADCVARHRDAEEDVVALDALVGALEAGILKNVILKYTDSDGVDAAVAALGDGEYHLAIIKRDPVIEGMVGVVGSLEGGAYAAA